MTYKIKTRLMAVILMTGSLVAGCTTILDEVQAGIATSAITPKAKKNADGTFVVPNFRLQRGQLFRQPHLRKLFQHFAP